jgi:hypothetical protein
MIDYTNSATFGLEVEALPGDRNQESEPLIAACCIQPSKKGDQL